MQQTVPVIIYVMFPTITTKLQWAQHLPWTANNLRNKQTNYSNNHWCDEKQHGKYIYI